MPNPLNNDLLNRDALLNPVILASLVVLALALTAVASSAGKLTTTLLFDPDPSPVNTAQETTRTAVDANAINQRNFFGLASDKLSVDVDHTLLLDQ